MPTLLIRHKVTDYATWQAVFDEQEATRRAHGCQLGRLFRSVSDPNEILIYLEWDDIERARLFAQSDDLREELKRGEVADEPDMWFLGDTNRAHV
ncbi:MAG: antibiotic biosynthesis monooxygenase [Chloroflexota bacterium]|nr:antibiotic biosynthesis monooxygenase [Chloroflexota bacterium]